MKKSIFIIILIFLLYIATKYMFKADEQKNQFCNQYTRCYTINALSVYKFKENYLISTVNNGKAQKLITFSPNRECLEVQTLSLITNNDINQFLNKSFDDLKAKIGEPHVDTGSGFYIPTYFTTDAYLIEFVLDANNDVFEIIKRDLFTYEVIYHVSNQDTGDDAPRTGAVR